MKIIKIEHLAEGRKYHHDQYQYQCPGCGYPHAFALQTEGGHHAWNQDYNFPTITPSLLQNFGGNSRLCHAYITNGRIAYLGDCEHALAGQEIELPDWPQK